MRAVIGPTQVSASYAAEAAAIVRSCVHCGFCNATCPTYQLTGDELEGPRGRIYLIKSLLEDGQGSSTLERHLDQCLVCRNCETTCPSGVRYGRLLELVRPQVVPLASLPWRQLARRALLRCCHRARFACVLAAGRLVRPLLPARLRALVPPSSRSGGRDANHPAHAASRALLGGCVQPALNPGIDRPPGRSSRISASRSSRHRAAPAAGHWPITSARRRRHARRRAPISMPGGRCSKTASKRWWRRPRGAACS